MDRIKTPLIVFAIIGMAFTFTSCTIMGDGEDCDPDTQNCETTDPVNPEPGWFGATAWHPDGEWIVAEHNVAFDTDGDDVPDSVARSGIWLVNATTGEVQDEPLLEWGHFPDWSPDGSQLVLHQGRHIYTLTVLSLDPPRIDTTSIRQLTTEGRNFYPDWSPDGEWIAYDNTVCGSTGEPLPDNSCGILVIKKDGTNKKLITRGRIPEWSSIYNKIYYQGLENKIFVADTINATFLKLTKDERSDSHPQYSPDGSIIAYLSAPPPPAPSVVSIWRMNPNGSSPQKMSPDWSGVFELAIY
tara:strand:- start:41 stop:937 length:897 start_codon:yes stop_codon:yes gene_type:complete